LPAGLKDPDHTFQRDDARGSDRQQQSTDPFAEGLLHVSCGQQPLLLALGLAVRGSVSGVIVVIFEPAPA
jgi:hypothetical protein